MSVTVEGATVVSASRYSHVLTDGDVGIEDSIHPVLVLGIFHHSSELFPVVSVADDDIC